MINDCIIDFDNLLKKYKEIDIYKFGNASTHKYLISLAINFTDSFSEIKTSNPNVIVSKTIAFFLQSNKVIMTKNKIYDFLIITFKFLNLYIEKTRNNQSVSKSQVIDNTLFDICNDILNQYDFLDGFVKIQIPNLIVDIITILLFKSDPYGNKISIYQTKSFYLKRKEAIINKNYSYPSGLLKKQLIDLESVDCENNNEVSTISHEKSKINQNVIKTESIELLPNVEKDKQLLPFNDEIVDRLSQITNRDAKSIKESLLRLNEREIKKVFDILISYYHMDQI
jgi:hypothetical protein